MMTEIPFSEIVLDDETLRFARRIAQEPQPETDQTKAPLAVLRSYRFLIRVPEEGRWYAKDDLRQYLAWYDARRETKRIERTRYWITTGIALSALAVSVVALIRTF